MTVQCFVDTNVILYATMGPSNDAAKHRRAVEILEATDFGISTQVVQEFYVNLIRKAKPLPPPEQIDAWLDWLAERPMILMNIELVRTGVALSRRFQISYWDAALIAAADRLGASVLYTEDLNHGQRYGTVLVQNPFRGL